jgi:hypothetical protein
VAWQPEPTVWLHEHALQPFLEEVRGERLVEVERIARHVELSLTELLQKADEEIGRAAADIDGKVVGAEGRLVQAENRHSELLARRSRRQQELERQRSLSLQAVERLTSVLVLPHPDRELPEFCRLLYDRETEAIAMHFVIEHEKALGRQVTDVHTQNLRYDITSLDLATGELRLIEIKGIGAPSGIVPLTPNERRTAEDRPDCYWLYIVTSCKTQPTLKEIKNPAQLHWHPVTKVDYYYLSVEEIDRTQGGKA